jgi:hypothetical protein
MLRTRAILFACVTALAAAGALAACGGDDVTVAPGGMDGGVDGIAPHPDGNMPPVDGNMPPVDGSHPDGNMPPVDGGDGGPCDFNQFVIGLIQNHTNNTDLPSQDLGQNCVDTHTTITGAPLFP